MNESCLGCPRRGRLDDPQLDHVMGAGVLPQFARVGVPEGPGVVEELAAGEVRPSKALVGTVEVDVVGDGAVHARGCHVAWSWEW